MTTSYVVSRIASRSDNHAPSNNDKQEDVPTSNNGNADS